MADILEHFAAARPGRGEEPCSCCRATGEHEDRSECDRCDGSGAMHRGDDAALPWCPGREADQPNPPRRRHWRQASAGHMAVEDLLNLHSDEALRRERRRTGDQYAGHGDATRVRTLYDRKAAEMAGNPAWHELDEPIRSGTVDPVLLATTGSGHTVVSEGGHRIVRAHQLGVSHLPVSWDPGSQAHRDDWESPEPLQHEGARRTTWFAAGPGLSFMATDLFHGSDREEPFSRFDFHQRSLKSEDEEESPLYKQEGEGMTTRWWNSRLGSHFTSEHHVASEIAQRMGGHGNVYHVELSQKNPRHYDSEHELAEEGVTWARRNGYKGLRNLGFDTEQGWHHAEALQNHPQAQQIAEGFRAHLQGRGYDGITYGNEYEGTKGHLSAIAFHPDQAKITETHGGYDPCRYDEPIEHEGVLAEHPEYGPREEFSNEASERDPGYFDAYRGRKRAWSAHVKRGLSLGHLSGDEAKGLGYYFGGHETDHNGDPKWQGLPREMYHATTDLPSVRQHGLKTRDELSQHQGGHGLGGGEDDTISVTTDHELGRGILRSLHEFHDVVNGKYTPQQMWAHAKAGTGAARPFHEDLMHYWDRSWKHGDPVPGGLHDALHGIHRQNEMGATQQDMDAKGPGWRPAHGDEGWTTGHTPPRQAHAYWERDMTPDEHRENAADFYKKFAAFREHAGGREDPNFFMTDEKAFAAKDPSKFALLHVRPRPGGQGYPMGGMREWRTGTGDALQVHHAEQLRGGQLHTAAFRRLAGNPDEYRMEMQPDEHGDPLHAMGGEHGDWPSDFYDRMHEYDFSHGEHGSAHLTQIRRARGNPEKRVRIYRAAPAQNPESRNAKKGEINHGDWVTLNKPYAEEDARGVNEVSAEKWKGPNHPGRSHIWSTVVPAKHVRSAGNDLMEWGYFGPDQKNLDHSSERCPHRNPFIKRERAPARRSFWDTQHHYGGPVPAAERTESVSHMLAHYAPTDFGTWGEVRDNIVWDHPKVRAFVDDIRQNGVRRPVPVDYESSPPRVMNGHMRLLSAEKAGLSEVPTRQHEGWMDPDDPDAYGRGPDDPGHWTNKDEWNQHEAVLPGLGNPHTGGREWYHGTQAEPGELKPHGFMDPAMMGAGAFEMPESEEGGHWNALLGTHFTVDHDVAREFAGGEHSSSANERHGEWDDGGYGEPHRGIVHARLGLKNPKVYDSEHDMDHEAYEHEHAAGNHPSDHVPGIGKPGSGDDEDDDELYEAEEMWPHAHRIARDYGHGEIPASTYGHYHTPFHGHPMRTAWLNTHPDKWGIADRFRKRLQEQGHDGVVYGNEYEKSKKGQDANRSAIVFDPDRIHVTQHHHADEPCDPEPAVHEAARDISKIRLKHEPPIVSGHWERDEQGVPSHWVDTDPAQGHHMLTALAPNNRTVGWMHWDKGVVRKIDVNDNWKRSGLGRKMWEHASTITPGLSHSDNRTEEGQGFAKAVGGPLPERMQDHPEWFHDAARRKPLQPGQEECWKCGVRADKSEFTEGSVYAPVAGRPMECTDKAACSQRRAEGSRTAAWTPSERIFGPTYGLDHRLFDEDEKLKPAVRDELMSRLGEVLGSALGPDWHLVVTAWLAGSQASRWTSPELEGNGDLDVLIGVSSGHARLAHPGLARMSDSEIGQRLNGILRERFNIDGWHPPFDPDGSYDLTGYVIHVSDIRSINPYAAYDLTEDGWAVKPPDMPSWTAEQFPQGPAVFAEARALASQVRAILRLPEPFRRQEAERIWKYIHEGRAQSFSEGGMGWMGTGNVLEKALDQASGKLVEKLKQAVYEPSHAPVALAHGMTTADLGSAHA